MTPAKSHMVRVDVNGTVVLMERHLAYSLMHTQQAKLVIDLDTAVDYIACDTD